MPTGRSEVNKSRCGTRTKRAAPLPPPLPIPPEAQAVQTRISATLSSIRDAAFPSCCDRPFLAAYRRLLWLVDLYHHEVLSQYYRPKTCRPGCSYCCYHWVVDVYSFEAAIIAQHLRDYFTDAVPRLIQALSSDYELYLRLEKAITEQKHSKNPFFEKLCLDEEELLLYCFYQMRRPCPLLDANKRCMIYEWRPLTCRMYISFGTPDACKPQHINRRAISTYLLDVDSESGNILDELHFRYVIFPDDVGLRSLLLKHLREDHQ